MNRSLLRLCTAYDTLTRTPEEAAALLAGGATCEPCEALAAANDAGAFAVAEVTPQTVLQGWEGPIVYEDQLTGDGRMIQANALIWDTLPMPFRNTIEDVGGHQGAVVTGHINTLERKSGGVIWATGDFDVTDPEGPGAEASRLAREGLQNGVSVDLDSVSFEIRVAGDLLANLSEPMQDGEEVVEPETDSEGRVTVISINADDEVMVTTSARIRAATQCAIPAFEGARIELIGEPTGGTSEGEGTPADPAEDSLAASSPSALLASAFPVRPPSAWFSDPGLTEPTRITVTEDGRVFGHLAVWGTCHTAFTGQCVTPPESASDYAHFKTGTLVTAEGDTVPVGRITLDTMHAKGTLSPAATLSHYEHTGRAVSDVAVGQDGIGIWVSGAMRSNVNDETIRSLRASPLSGDWRAIGGNLELVAALAVNVPGFPIPRPAGLVASGAMVSLVASGMLAPRESPAVDQLSDEDVRYLKRLANQERKFDQETQATASALAARVVLAATRERVVRLASTLSL